MSLRPPKLVNIVGQEDIKERLRISIDYTRETKTCLGHCLFYGQPGLGKTTFAKAITAELKTGAFILNGGNISSPKDLAPVLLKIKKGEVLFIDEIHRINESTEEFLYTVMEDFRMDVGDEDCISIDLPKFTLIGATTMMGSISAPMRDRFVYKYHLKPYSVDELAKVVEWNSSILGLNLTEGASIMVAKMSRGTPRILNNYMIWLRDCYSLYKPEINSQDVSQALEMMGVDKKGLDETDRAYLSFLANSNAQ